MQTRRLGRTDHQSSIAILGGAVFFADTPESAAPTFQMALERGVNHLDIAPGYGMAERAIGPHIPDVREKLFVACKTSETTRDAALARIDKTLARLQVDHLDLYQAHGVTSITDLDARDEAFKVIVEARDQGITRFAGVTGHDLGAPRAHLEALRRYDLDTVMFPVFPAVWSDTSYREDAEALLDECMTRDVGVMAIKAVAWRPWGDRTVETSSWYEPFRSGEGITRGVGFALSTPGVHSFCTSSSVDVLEASLKAAETYKPLSTEERKLAMTTAAEEDPIFPLREHARLPSGW